MSEVNNTPAAPANTAGEAQASEATNNNTENLEVGQEVSEENVSDESSTKESAAEKKEEAKVAKKLKKLKIKVDQKEFEEELPFEVDESDKATLDYLTKQLQLARMGQKRASEASEFKKQLNEVTDYLSQAKGNPGKLRELIKKLDGDEKALAAMIVEEEIAKAKKSPDQLEKERFENELKQLKEERDREKKEFEQREFERAYTQELQRLESEMSASIQKFKLPDSPRIKQTFAQYLQRANEKNMEVSMDDIAPLVVEDLKSIYKEWVKLSPDEFIEELLGKDGLTRLRKRNLAKAKEVPPVPLNKSLPDSGVKAEPEKPKPKESFRDFFKNMK